MPRFVARPVVIEAHQWPQGALEMPDAFRAVLGRMRPGISADIRTGDQRNVCHAGDWIARGGDGTFFVIRGATFDSLYAEQTTLTLQSVQRRQSTRTPVDA